MKKYFAFILVMFAFMFAAPVVYAQEIGLDDTAVSTVQGIFNAIVVLLSSGTVASQLTDILKRIPYFTKEERSKIGGQLAATIATVMAIVLGVVFREILPYLEYLDATGIWNIVLSIVAVLPAAFVARYFYWLSK